MILYGGGIRLKVFNQGYNQVEFTATYDLFILAVVILFVCI